MDIHRTGPASSWAGYTDLRHVDILNLGEVGSRMGPRQFSALFQGLKDGLLKTSLSLVPNPCSPSNLLKQFQLCMHPDTGNGASRDRILGRNGFHHK